MSELRTRMIRDMTVRGFSPRTHEAYIRQVVGLARHYRRAHDQLSADEVQTYLAHLFQARKRSWNVDLQTDAFAKFDRISHKVDLAEAEADAFRDLAGSAGVPLEVEPGTGDNEADVEAELAELKKKLNR